MFRRVSRQLENDSGQAFAGKLVSAASQDSPLNFQVGQNFQDQCRNFDSGCFLTHNQFSFEARVVKYLPGTLAGCTASDKITDSLIIGVFIIARRDSIAVSRNIIIKRAKLAPVTQDSDGPADRFNRAVECV